MGITKRTSKLVGMEDHNDKTSSGYGNFKIDRGNRRRRGPFRMIDDSPYNYGYAREEE
tara:strand:- start:242 stop:415 length:174 start_codon:yes stop_codon:yes gene_type:complete